MDKTHGRSDPMGAKPNYTRYAANFHNTNNSLAAFRPGVRFRLRRAFVRISPPGRDVRIRKSGTWRGFGTETIDRKGPKHRLKNPSPSAGIGVSAHDFSGSPTRHAGFDKTGTTPDSYDAPRSDFSRFGKQGRE
ncbi:MAG: hypothetical protein VB138_11720 [Burkholderia sp.]